MRKSPILAALVLVSLGAVPAASAEDKPAPETVPTVKKAGKTIWEDTKAAGRAIRDSKVGQAVKEAGQDIGDEAVEVGKDTAEVSKDIWRRTTKASVNMAKAVREASVAFWSDLTREREDEAARLRKENQDLKAKADQE